MCFFKIKDVAPCNSWLYVVLHNFWKVQEINVIFLNYLSSLFSERGEVVEFEIEWWRNIFNICVSVLRLIDCRTLSEHLLEIDLSSSLS